MKSYVKKLAELKDFEIPAELQNTEVPMEEIDEQIRRLSLGLGGTEEVASYEENACVSCVDAEGRQVLLYPDLHLRMAEEAEKARCAKPGDHLNLSLNGTEKTVTVEKILVNRAAAVDDELGKKAGYPVESLEEFRKILKKEAEELLREGNVKTLTALLFDYIGSASELYLDEEEQNSWAEELGDRAFREELEMGVDLRFTEEGDMLTEEEAIAGLAEQYKAQFAGLVVTEKICQDDAYETDVELLRSQLEMQGMKVDESFLQNLVENDRMGHVFDKLSAFAEEVLR